VEDWPIATIIVACNVSKLKLVKILEIIGYAAAGKAP
jgi:hypothetical protein